jgi:tol-pal system protein YbgF
MSNKPTIRRTGTALALAAAAWGLSPLAFAAAAVPPPIVESLPLGVQQPGAPRTVEDRLSRLERQLDSQILLDLLSRLETLQRETQELRGTLEMQGHRADSLEQRQRELYLDIDRRLRRLESAAANTDANAGAGVDAAVAPTAVESSVDAPASPPPAAPAVAATTSAAAAVAAETVSAPAAAAQDTRAERDAYDRAYGLVQAGRYEDSIASFRAFLARYPGSEYASNAQYWLGEANYVSRRFDEAAQEFGKVIQFYPDSGKASDALLKLGFSQYELQQWDQAGVTLERVVEQYPRSTAGQLAEGRLQRMRMEGRR